MQAVGISAPVYDQSSVRLDVMTLPVPAPREGQVLVKVISSSVNHLDLLWKVIHPALAWKAFVAAWEVQGDFPKVLGLDVAGTVAAVGPGVSNLNIGDAVWGFNAAGCVYDEHTLGGIAGHTWAEYVAVNADQVGLKPAGFSFTEAGATPLAALTALRALKLAGAPWKAGGSVLILGAAGGVGHFAVQLAKALGATEVIATASAAHQEFLASLGVDQLIDYRASDWWNSSVIYDSSLIAVIDTVLQPQTGDRAFGKLKCHGHFVSLCAGIPDCGTPMASSITQLKHPTISQHSLRCTSGSCAGAEQLDELGHYVNTGKLKVHVDKTVLLDSVNIGIASLEGGHTVGKIGISVAKSDTSALPSSVMV